MAAVLKIDIRRRLVYSSFYGKVTGEELLAHRQRILAEPFFNPAFDEIVDFSDVSQTLINEQALASLASEKSIYGPNSRHVVVAPSDMPYEIGLRYQQLAQQSRPNLHVVRSLSEAYQLLAR